VTLVAALVMRHDHRALPAHVPSGARARQRGERRHDVIAGDLDQLSGAGVIAAGQHPAGLVDIESLE
jgi:hypothetical protein